MKERTGNEVRQLFLDYFKSKRHMVEPGASLVPHNDPSLLWINSGVAALKKYFDGSEKSLSNRIVNAQKSIRTNDIENVGRTARHHTFFEMLGNFSIGDYFKEDAILYAWEFFTDERWIGFPKEKLYITVYSDDEEAYRIWVDKCHVDPSHILKTKDNFWEIGEGPGGPNSEIFYDRGLAYDPDGLGVQLFFDELENDRYIEVWNIVFSQFDCKSDVERKDYQELPQKNIDTGMGLERLVSLIQEGETNFDTDLFMPIIRECEKIAKHSYNGAYKMAYRVIADHIRTVTFALSDGALFSNNGRGYVLRRVLRRAIRYGIKLGINGPFMYQLVPIVSENMKDFYPYLMNQIAFNQNLIKIEEETFHKTLKNGEQLLKEAIDKTIGTTLSGSVVFKLYDTYGFPYELTAEIAKDHGLITDEKQFKLEMQKQKERAREARGTTTSMVSQSADLLNFESKSDFIGYDHLQVKANVIGLFKDGVQVDVLETNGNVIFDVTCFYAESGGQVADTGYLLINGVKIDIVNVKKAPHGQFLHEVVLNNTTISMHDEVYLCVDTIRRNKIIANHSATHLLQSALKKIVGNHINQAGSFNNDEYLRFDFTHFEKVSEQQLSDIEDLVNIYIQNKYEVKKELLSLEEAKKSGATALFDEKYGAIVRVVTMGEVSKEFCGGCHVTNTNEIGLLKIVSEESIGSGIRRISAKTGYAAYCDYKNEENTLKAIAHQLKMKSINRVDEKVNSIIEDNMVLKRTLDSMKEEAMANLVETLSKQVIEVNNYHVIIQYVHGVDASSLKNIAILMRDKMKNTLIFLATDNGDKVVFASACDKGLIKEGIHCGNLVKEAAQICEGNGGGKPDLAQAGGKNITKLKEAMEKIALNVGLSL